MTHTSSRDCDVEDVAADILTYLSEHPDAQDTLPGIIRWWLLEQRIRHQTVVVRQALRHLVQSGMVIECRARHAPIRYRMNKRKKKEIQDLLRELLPLEETSQSNDERPGRTVSTCVAINGRWDE